MSTYTPPESSVAEMIYREEKESQRQSQRLKPLPAGEIKAVLRDQAESPAARGNALLLLLMRRDAELPEILLELFDDPDPHLWRMAVRSWRPADPRMIAKLWSLLDDPIDRNWSEAAGALARLQDKALLPRLADWLANTEDARRNVAVNCLEQLDAPEARELLREAWQRDGWNEEPRAALAAALLSQGNERGLALLESQALRAQHAGAVFAATSLYFHRRARGLELMLHILDHGSMEAKQSMVNQVWNLAHLPHAFTADGLQEARLWVEQQRDSVSRA